MSGMLLSTIHPFLTFADTLIIDSSRLFILHTMFFFVSLIVSEEAAPACIRELGVMGCFQFTDLNPELTPFQRRFVSFIKRCDEIERKIRYVTGEVKKMQVPLQSAGSVEGFIEASQASEVSSGSYLLESIESKLDVYEQQLLELNKYSDKLTDEYGHKVNNPPIICMLLPYVTILCVL